MAVREVLLFGNPKLYEISRPVREDELGSIEKVVEDLHETLMDFKERYGAGRAIAAPKIDGILAISRAIDTHSFALRSQKQLLSVEGIIYTEMFEKENKDGFS